VEVGTTGSQYHNHGKVTQTQRISPLILARSKILETFLDFKFLLFEADRIHHDEDIKSSFENGSSSIQIVSETVTSFLIS
jgi:hypothetical protein